MHAMVGIFKMDTKHFDRQVKELNERIVPFVKHQPGFVSATWTYDRSLGRSYSLAVFDSQEDAEKLATFVRADGSRPNDAGVQMESIVVAEVLAEAKRS
jgi:hypothetical protein